MASNAYGSYGNPYQQSSAQQYTAYQTAPPSNGSAQALRQYMQPPATQAQDYMSYSTQSYSGQTGAYAAPQDNSWHAGNYGGARETTNRAAEVLRNMSNTPYTPSSTSAVNQGGFTATHAIPSSNRYATGHSHSPHMQTQNHPAQPAHPVSVNDNQAQTIPSRGLPSATVTTGYPSQRVQILHSDQQRPASPAQQSFQTVSSNAAKDSNIASSTNQMYNDYSGRQLPNVEATRSSQTASSSTSYNYPNTAVSATSIAPPSSSTSVADMYPAHGATTVDPTAIYDPWVEYRRKQEAEAKKAAEEAARAEEEMKVKEKMEEEHRRKEEEERLRKPPQKPKPKTNKGQKQQSNQADGTLASPEPSAGSGEALEAEIRAMVAKMRELNNKDPALLARIWEEERRAKASLTVKNKAAPQAQRTQPAQAAQAPKPQAVDAKKKTKVAQSPNASVGKSAPPPSAQAVPSVARPPMKKPSGSTVWPPEKKAHLAQAAVAYLHTQNPGNSIDSSRILAMLETNPSYIELCQQLEQEGLKLDRAAFAKNLLIAVPDVNSAPRRPSLHAPSVPSNKPQVPPAIMKTEVATPIRTSSLPIGATPAQAVTPALVARMVPIKPELKRPANKVEAARKRNISDLVDLTQLSDEDDMEPPAKKINTSPMHPFESLDASTHDVMAVDKEPKIQNFPMTNVVPSQAPTAVSPQPIILRGNDYVEPLDKRKALRCNTYNPATIARDVLLACGRHPSQRQLNQHLDCLRSTVPGIGYDSDLNTIRWDLIDPGKPPPGYFNDGIQVVTEDADDEDDSDDEDRGPGVRQPSNGIGQEGGAAARGAQALPAINPFKGQKRGRPPRFSLPDDNVPETPTRSLNPTNMSASAPRPTPPSSGVGYQAFRSATQYGPNGEPLPKKRGRPVGWRKAIHGSAATQAKTPGNNHLAPPKEKHSQTSSLSNIRTEDHEPILISSCSPSVANRVLHYQSYKCEWQDCEAELHNLDTLKRHVFKVHAKTAPQSSLECLWGDCGKQRASFDPNTNMMVEHRTPYLFYHEDDWRAHIQQLHFDPLSWKLGDGPASGLSDTQDSDAYFSDAQGRQITPRIIVEPKVLQTDNTTLQPLLTVPRGRGRPPKNRVEQDAREALSLLVAQKKRVGGPGMDRGGATLVNDERRRGFKDTYDIEEELVDVED